MKSGRLHRASTQWGHESFDAPHRAKSFLTAHRSFKVFDEILQRDAQHAAIVAELNKVYALVSNFTPTDVALLSPELFPKTRLRHTLCTPRSGQ